jgi:hypothetical protein
MRAVIYSAMMALTLTTAAEPHVFECARGCKKPVAECQRVSG